MRIHHCPFRFPFKASSRFEVGLEALLRSCRPVGAIPHGKGFIFFSLPNIVPPGIVEGPATAVGLQLAAVKVCQLIRWCHQSADIPNPRPLQFRADFFPVVWMLGNPEGTGIADTTISTTYTGHFFDSVSQHPIPLFFFRYEVIQCIESTGISLTNISEMINDYNTRERNNDEYLPSKR